MLKLIIFLTIFLILDILSDRWLRKKLNIEKRDWRIYKHINSLQKWVERAILISFLITIIFVGNPFPVLIVYFSILTLIRIFFEWKYEKARKEYIMTFYTMVSILLFTGVAILFI